MHIALLIIGGLLIYYFIYHIVKNAVRDGVNEARKMSYTDENYKKNRHRISQKICPKCGKTYDIDYPKCPHCGNR